MGLVQLRFLSYYRVGLKLYFPMQCWWDYGLVPGKSHTVLQQFTRCHFLGDWWANTRMLTFGRALSGFTILNSCTNQAIMSKILGHYYLSFFHRCELGMSKVVDERERQNSICWVSTVCQLYDDCFIKVSQQPGEDRDISSILLVRQERRGPCCGAHKGWIQGVYEFI